MAGYDWVEGGYFELDLGPDDFDHDCTTPMEITAEDWEAYRADMAGPPTERLSAEEVEALLKAAAEYMARNGEPVW